MSWLIGFYFGGLVVTMLERWREFRNGLPAVVVLALKQNPCKLAAFMLAMIVLWPVGNALVFAFERDQRRQQAEDEDEFQRVEATRRDR